MEGVWDAIVEMAKKFLKWLREIGSKMAQRFRAFVDGTQVKLKAISKRFESDDVQQTLTTTINGHTRELLGIARNGGHFSPRASVDKLLGDKKRAIAGGREVLGDLYRLFHKLPELVIYTPKTEQAYLEAEDDYNKASAEFDHWIEKIDGSMQLAVGPLEIGIVDKKFRLNDDALSDLSEESVEITYDRDEYVKALELLTNELWGTKHGYNETFVRGGVYDPEYKLEDIANGSRVFYDPDREHLTKLRVEVYRKKLEVLRALKLLELSFNESLRKALSMYIDGFDKVSQRLKAKR